MATDLPSVSSIALLVPCYNAATFLPLLLAAAQQQTVPFQEIICYDDGSSDDTYEVAKSFGVRVIQGKRNRGVSFARNSLLEATTSKWVHFHDADDLLSERFVEVMSQHTQDERVVTFCGVRKVSSKEIDNLNSGIIQTYEDINNTDDYVAYMLRQFVHLNSAVFPLARIRQIGGFCPYLSVAEDMDLMLRMAASQTQFHAIPDVLVTRVDRETSLTKRTQTFKHWKNALHYLNRCHKRLPKQYHAFLGDKALYYARCFYWADQIVDAKRSFRLAQRCGVTIPANLPLWQQNIARCVGTEKLFWLLRQWSKVRAH